MPAVNLERPTDSYASTIYLSWKLTVLTGFEPLPDQHKLKNSLPETTGCYQ